MLVALVLPVYGWRTTTLIAGLIALIPITLTPLTPGPARKATLGTGRADRR